jgi:hypothetical protein
MALAAAQVIDAVAARVAASGRPAYTSRLWPLAEAALPAWRVTAEQEDVERQAVGGDIAQHSLTVQLRGCVRATDDLDDALHALAATVLSLVFAAPVPYDMQLTAIDRYLATEGEAALGVITLTVRATYYVSAAAPETIL